MEEVPGAQSTILTMDDVIVLQRMLGRAELEHFPRSSGGPEFTRLEVAGLSVPRLGPVTVHMYFNEGSHKQPHFHVLRKGKGEASFAIEPFRCLGGSVPIRVEREIRDWTYRYQEKLIESWRVVSSGAKPIRFDV